MPCLFQTQAQWEAARTKTARSRRGCQAHAANLGEPRVNTESRQHDPQTEASSDVRGDQVLIKLPEPGSRGGFVLNSDSAQRWCFCSGWVHGVFDLMYCFRPPNSASRMWVNRSEKPLLCLGVFLDCRVLHPSLMPPGCCLQWAGVWSQGQTTHLDPKFPFHACCLP